MHSHMIGFPISTEDQEKTDRQGVQRKLKPRTNRNYDIYGPLYEMSNRFLSNGYSVLYGAEFVPNESAKDRLVNNIQNVNNTEEVQNNISKGQLVVIDADSIHEENDGNYKSMVKYWWLQVTRLQEKLQKKSKGIMMFSAPDVYFTHNQHDIFMMFEEEMGKTFSPNVSMLCWYKEKWLINLSLALLIRTLVDHKYTIHNDWKRTEWTRAKIISLISRGIDKLLGDGSATLLFRTMKSIYGFNHEVAITKPVVFEGILKRLLGNDDYYANSVIASIFEEIMKEISFSRKAIPIPEEI